MHDPKMVEMVARAYQDTADAITVDEWQLDPRDCERRCVTAALDALAAAGRLVPEGWVNCSRCLYWSTDDEGGSCVLKLNDPDQHRWRTKATDGCLDGLAAAPRPEDQP